MDITEILRQQEQHYLDGVLCKMSRWAVDEAISEIKQLRAENERLQKQLQVESKAAAYWMGEANKEHNENERLEAENERLEAENERLRKENKAQRFKEVQIEQPYDAIIKVGDHIEWSSDRQTDRGPCTGTVWWIKDGVVCVKFGQDDFEHWSLGKIKFNRVSLHHRTGKPLFFAA